MSRQYYYKINGKLKKYVYCSICQSGPFREDEESFEFLSLGGANTPINYCRSCCFLRGLTDHLNKSEKKIDPQIEPVIFEDKKSFKDTKPVIFEDKKSSKNTESVVFEDKKSCKNTESVMFDDEKSSKENESDIKIDKKKNEDISNNFYFIVVRCFDKTLYSSVTSSIELALSNMNRGKGPNYTKHKTRRPVELLYSEIVKDKKQGKDSKKTFDSISDKEEYVISLKSN